LSVYFYVAHQAFTFACYDLRIVKYAKHHSSVGALLLKLGKIFIPYPNVLPELLINAYTVDTHYIISFCNACFVIVVSVFLAWMHQWPTNMS